MNSQPRHVACLVETDPAWRSGIHWTIEMLLHPFGMVPRWIADTGEAAGGLAYVAPEVSLPNGWLLLPKAPEVERFIGEKRLPEPEETGRRSWDGYDVPVLFPICHDQDFETEAEEGRITFDIVASTFFWLSGWAEVVGGKIDRHGRQAHEGSYFARHRCVDVPVVDVYRFMLAEQMGRQGMQTKLHDWGGKDWAFCPTFDIDYLCKWRPGILYREFVERPLLGKPNQSVSNRMRRLWATTTQLLTRRDPYHAGIRQFLEDLESDNGSGTFFLKTGGYRPYDVVTDRSEYAQKKAVGMIVSAGCEAGLHPAYFTAFHPGRLKSERERLSGLSGRRPSSIRQHYLRHDPLLSPVLLEEEGFRIDSSLGYADKSGFRRGTCHPFRLYDLLNDRATEVWEMPLIVMDSTLFNYELLSPSEAVRRIDNLMQICREMGGVFVALWHNILLDSVDFPGWLEQYRHAMKRGREWDAQTDTLSALLSESGVGGGA